MSEPAAETTPTPQAPGLVIQDLDTTHDRHTTPTMGTHTIGRWSYPTRVFDGHAQYQTREGEWLDIPLEPEDAQSDEAAGDGTP